jgi:hypothetical protein
MGFLHELQFFQTFCSIDNLLIKPRYTARDSHPFFLFSKLVTQNASSILYEMRVGIDMPDKGVFCPTKEKKSQNIFVVEKN